MDARRCVPIVLLAALLAVPAPAAAKRKHKRHHRRPAPAAIVPAAPAANPPAPIGPCPDADLEPAPDALDRVRAATLCLVNQERAKVGLGALAEQPQLELAAAGHVGDMLARDFYAHVDLDGRTPLDRVTADGYLFGARSWVVGENLAVATGDASPARIVAAWMASPGHRENILRPEFRDSGIAIAAGVPASERDGLPGGLYAQEFGFRSP
jgi:uncharacterized protein YkwD